MPKLHKKPLHYYRSRKHIDYHRIRWQQVRLIHRPAGLHARCRPLWAITQILKEQPNPCDILFVRAPHRTKYREYKEKQEVRASNQLICQERLVIWAIYQKCQFVSIPEQPGRPPAAGWSRQEDQGYFQPWKQNFWWSRFLSQVDCHFSPNSLGEDRTSQSLREKPQPIVFPLRIQPYRKDLPQMFPWNSWVSHQPSIIRVLLR